MGYPSPPVDVFREDGKARDEDEVPAADNAYGDNLYTDPEATIGRRGWTFPKSTPPGRLMSLLFAAACELRTSPAVCALWLAFVRELRSRWKRRESLPHLTDVPGNIITNPTVITPTPSVGAPEIPSTTGRSASDPPSDDRHSIDGPK